MSPSGVADLAPDADGWLSVRLPYRPPLPLDALIRFLGLRAVPGVEEVVDGSYRRVMRLPGGLGVVSLGPAEADLAGSAGDSDDRPPQVRCRMRLDDPRDLPIAVAACRRLLDLDTDPSAVDATLGADAVLAPFVAAVPGRRAPVHVDADELAVRAVLGQQVSLAAARRLAGRLAELCGEPVAEPVGGLAVAFPAPAAIVAADLDQIGMPGSRRMVLRTLARALAEREIVLAPGADRDEADHAERKLLELRGIGPWTATYIRMRGLGDPDVFLATDVGVRHALERLGIAGSEAPDERWRPWRSYAVHHLWASLPSGRDRAVSSSKACWCPGGGSRP